MAPSIHSVIMAGGSGTRFWPASRTRRPKQFLPLARGKPLIRAAVERVRDVSGPERTWIITNPVQARELPSVLPDFPADRVIVEPEARDTAPCVALAAATIANSDPGATIAMLAADHVIEPVDAFGALLERAAAIAADDETLVTFGIKPTHPATGYGYIETGDPLPALADGSQPEGFAVAQFREKPDRETAQEFLNAGRFLWNSGIFVWTAKGIQRAMERGNAELAEAARAMAAAVSSGDESALRAAFGTAPKTSVDFAVMEHADKIAVLPASIEWDDVGSFLALSAVAPRDGDGNVHLLTDGAQLSTAASEDNIVYATGDRTVALFGCKDLVVVAVDDAVLVCPKRKADDLKVMVQRLKESGRTDLL